MISAECPRNVEWSLPSIEDQIFTKQSSEPCKTEIKPDGKQRYLNTVQGVIYLKEHVSLWRSWDRCDQMQYSTLQTGGQGSACADACAHSCWQDWWSWSAALLLTLCLSAPSLLMKKKKKGESGNDKYSKKWSLIIDNSIKSNQACVLVFGGD